MATRATRGTKRSRVEVVLFVAFELGWNEWKLGFSTGLGQKPRLRTMRARSLPRLEREIQEAKKRFDLPSTVKVVSCFEAGRDGFWLHRYLTAMGVDNSVVDSSSIEVNRRARRAKSDGLDVGKLLMMLIRYHFGERKVWSVVRVPTVEQEDGRQLHRELKTLKKEETRTRNRIKGLLASQGIALKKATDLSKALSRMRLWDGSPLPPALSRRLLRQWEHAAYLHQQVLELQAERRRELATSPSVSTGKVRQLTRLKGIGEGGSWVFVNEFFGWRKFRNGKEIGSLAGLTPTPYQSGTSGREQGISKAGNRHVRAMAVELAWSWVRHQPASTLSRWFERRFAAGGRRARKVGIVAVARKLLIELWRFLETGAIPQGAELKA